MNTAILLVGLLVGSPRPPENPGRGSRDSARILARFAADPSGFSPLFGKGDPGAHPVRFGVATPAGVGPAARDKALESALFRPRAVTSLQMSWPLK